MTKSKATALPFILIIIQLEQAQVSLSRLLFWSKPVIWILWTLESFPNGFLLIGFISLSSSSKWFVSFKTKSRASLAAMSFGLFKRACFSVVFQGFLSFFLFVPGGYQKQDRGWWSIFGKFTTSFPPWMKQDLRKKQTVTWLTFYIKEFLQVSLFPELSQDLQWPFLKTL